MLPFVVHKIFPFYINGVKNLNIQLQNQRVKKLRSARAVSRQTSERVVQQCAHSWRSDRPALANFYTMPSRWGLFNPLETKLRLL